MTLMFLRSIEFILQSVPQFDLTELKTFLTVLLIDVFYHDFQTVGYSTGLSCSVATVGWTSGSRAYHSKPLANDLLITATGNRRKTYHFHITWKFQIPCTLLRFTLFINDQNDFCLLFGHKGDYMGNTLMKTLVNLVIKFYIPFHQALMTSLRSRQVERKSRWFCT